MKKPFADLPDFQKEEWHARICSFLKDIAIHNPDFGDHLKIEEIFNCFVHEVAHPSWVLTHLNDLNFIAETHEYLVKWAEEAYVYDITHPPRYRTVPADPLTDKQKNFIQIMCRDMKLPLPIGFAYLSKKEAIAVIGQLSPIYNDWKNKKGAAS